MNSGFFHEIRTNSQISEGFYFETSCYEFEKKEHCLLCVWMRNWQEHFCKVLIFCSVMEFALTVNLKCTAPQSPKVRVCMCDTRATRQVVRQE